MHSSLTGVARILLAALFLISGVRKLMVFGIVSGMMAGKGFPVPDVFLGLAILLEIAGGLMLIANWNAKYAAWALAALRWSPVPFFTASGMCGAPHRRSSTTRSIIS